MSKNLQRKYQKEDLDRFLSDLNQDLENWKSEGLDLDDEWSFHILELPQLFQELARIYLEEKDILKHSDLFKILEKTLEFVIDSMDFLPEAILGPSGYADDVYVAACCAERLSGLYQTNIKTSLIIENAEEMLGRIVKKHCDNFLKA